MQRAVTAARSRASGVALDRAATSLQLGLDGIGEVGLDFLYVAHDAAGVELATPQGGDFCHGLNVIRKREDGRLHGIDDRLVGRSGAQRGAKPVQPRVVGKQQVVLGA